MCIRDSVNTILNHAVEKTKDFNYNDIINAVRDYIENTSIFEGEKGVNEMSSSEERSLNNIKASIKEQTELLKQQNLLGHDTTITRNLIFHLQNHLSERLANNTSVPKDSQTLGELREERQLGDINAGLKEIFYFYCRQQCATRKKQTFDELSRSASYMTVGEFVTFCKDFKIPLKASRVKELFKRQMRVSAQLDFNSFLVQLYQHCRCCWEAWPKK
eukprot:TRINITY_DN10670_c0_g1_i11.p1 TRINITY_DN10670_c0_g1~~TRINITY_DN10670_c0_g1_i11.p1  ORF type:complete len:217 (+),score=26.38 TRINITY_DN10670_c0_g1_i11:82-732(+)